MLVAPCRIPRSAFAGGGINDSRERQQQPQGIPARGQQVLRLPFPAGAVARALALLPEERCSLTTHHPSPLSAQYLIAWVFTFASITLLWGGCMIVAGDLGSKSVQVIDTVQVVFLVSCVLVRRV